MTTVPPPRSPGDVLRLARELLATPDKWTQGAFARHANGNPIGCLTDDAACFCSSGAIQRVAHECYDHIKMEAFDLVERAMGVEGSGAVNIATYNDAPERTHAEVLAAFDRAISLADKGVMP